MTRELWLEKAIQELKPLFKQCGSDIPAIRVSVGFPIGAKRAKHGAIGQYWPSERASDGVAQIFVSPILEDPIRTLDVLTHEIVHACTPGAGHGKSFKRLAVALGLTGKMTATVAGPELTERLNTISQTLGPFPHAALDPTKQKKQSTRLGKVSCESCGYTVRVTRKWLEMGAPICPCNGEQMTQS